MSKIALVTGGSSGIGLAIAKALKRDGYELIIVGRDKLALDEAAQQLSASAYQVDVANLEQLKALSEEFSSIGLDVLVNSAGYAYPQSVEKLSPKQFALHIDVNLRGPLFLTQYLLGALKKKRGCVINVSSIMVNVNLPNYTCYMAVKGALEVVTRSLAFELADSGVRVNAVSPGAIDTPMFSKLGYSPEQVSEIKKHKIINTPLNRLGRAEEVAKVVMALINGKYVTGSLWSIDGGASL